MRQIEILTRRTIKLYLRNPLAILFSFVYMLLFLVLITLFLGDYMAQGMKEAYASVVGMDFSAMRWLVDATAMAGVLMINCILVPLNVLTIMVEDSTTQKLDSFLVSSVSRSKLAVGYWLSPFLVGMIMNTVCLFIAEGFIVMNGGKWLCLSETLQVIGLITVNTFSTTSILFVAALLIKKTQLYNTFTGIMSALVGFITGAFLPIGMFPSNIQKLFAFMPAHHGATMMREVMTKDAFGAVFGNVTDQMVKESFMTAEEIAEIYQSENGIIYMLGSIRFGFPLMFAVVIGSGILFLVIGCVLMRKQMRR
ncbi:hypothetical protein C823_006809 [Eubacterium plexicaudatum ASF492]|uniref:ABC-2 type transporter transmembrane domain-containing protein n=1 Tax=Eubacterium plexicaudatum ASF492 TaxID=1235802 RepID=N2ABT7_9FIRM|nr:hypothetical protein C823_006809 [Eubacterium plexicaudatum ASF492]